MTLDEIKKLPKVVLHEHIDGSIRPQTLIELANNQRTPLTDEQIKTIQVSSGNRGDLNQYLEAFKVPLQVMQTKEAITRIVKECIEDLKEDNVVLAELRFAPGQHLAKGLSQEEVIEAAIEGTKQITGIRADLILCCMRGDKNDKVLEERNIKTVKLAEKYLNKGVCAVDLAGAEALFPLVNHENLFHLAKELGVPYTIHAGEAEGKVDGCQSIRKALDLGAKRIGHGVACIKDEELIQELIDKKVVLEMCPTSNYQTTAIESPEDHPMVPLLRRGVAVTINTDNRTVSGITLSEEILKAQQMLGLTDNEINTLMRNAYRGSFYHQKRKESQENSDIVRRMREIEESYRPDER